jgi:hypothetical protein
MRSVAYHENNNINQDKATKNQYRWYVCVLMFLSEEH